MITNTREVLVYNGINSFSLNSLSNEIKNKIDKIFRVNPTTGLSYQIWSPSSGIYQFSALNCGEIYIIESNSINYIISNNLITYNSLLCNSTPTPTPTVVNPAYFSVADGISPSNFVIRLTDSNKINQARSQLNGSAPLMSITGIIVKESVWYNPSYNFHYDSSTIDFFELSIEVCDATFAYTEEHLQEAGGSFLPELRLCPWGSYLVEELNLSQPTPTPTNTPTFTATPANNLQVIYIRWI